LKNKIIILVLCILFVFNLFVLSISASTEWHNSTFGGSVTVEEPSWENTCPSSSSESPSNKTINVSINVGYWNVTINDADGNATSGTINCSGIANMSWSSQANGTRSLTLQTLSYNTNYTVWLNFTDGHCDVNETYWFITEAEQTIKWESSTFGADVIVKGYQSGDWSDWWYLNYTTQGEMEIRNPYPANQSLTVERPPTNISAYVNGTSLSIYYYFYNNTPTTSSWSLITSWTGQSSGRFEYDTSNGIPSGTDTRFAWGNTQYQWSINVTNGTTWINHSYWFNTSGSRYDVTNSGDVVSGDVSICWANRQGQATYNGIYDVTNSGDIVSGDVSAIWANRS